MAIYFNKLGRNVFCRESRKLSGLLASMAVPLFLTGCGNISGLIDAHDEFGCGVPGKANCATLSQTYEAEHAADEANDLARARKALEGNTKAAEDLDGSRERGPERDFQKASRQAHLKTNSKASAALTEPKTEPETQSEKAFVCETSGLTTSAAQSLLRAQRKTDARMRAVLGKKTQLPARAPEKVVMLWVLPWVDAEGDLHGDSRVWVRVKDALWRIERVRSRAMRSAELGVEP